MAEVFLRAGMRLDIPNREEIQQAAADAISAGERERARAFKLLDLPESLYGTVAGAAITLGVGTGQICGPESGYIWQVGRLVVSGLASGTTPDVVNLYKNDRFAGPPLWQFNGNNFAYTFGKLQLLLKNGETFSLQNVGALAATGRILLSGNVTEVPQEMAWKLD